MPFKFWGISALQIAQFFYTFERITLGQLEFDEPKNHLGKARLAMDYLGLFWSHSEGRRTIQNIAIRIMIVIASHLE